MPLAVAVVAAVATTYSAVQNRRAATRQRRAARAEKRIQDVQNIRERTRAFAAARTQAAQIENLQAVSGAQTSGFAGARGSLLSQTYSNIGFSQQLEQLGNQRYRYLQQAAGFTSRADTGMAVARIAQSFSSTGGGQ